MPGTGPHGARPGAAVTPSRRGAAALLAATVVNLPFGTLYAFSVFLKPMEALLGATRAEMGFVFGLATVTLTVGMNVAPQIYRRLSPITLALACGLTSGLGLVLAASAGLTVLSQAAAIVQAYGGAAAFAVGATTFITGAVGAARIGGGWLVDHFAAARVGVGAHACSLVGAMLLMLNPTPLSAALALGLIGVGYGIVSGLAAGAIAQYWHKNQFGHVAGRLYIAWCAAAVGLPVLAGALFDRTGSYASAVWVAAGINGVGMLVAGRLPAR